MRPFDDELRGMVGEWLRKADLDMAVAARLADDSDDFRDSIAFHSQQAVEKYLKALLIRRQVEFPKTHDLERLLHLLRQVEPEMAEGLMQAAWLTPFGVDIRYPGDFPDTLPGDEIRALDLARPVRAAVMSVLTPYLAGG